MSIYAAWGYILLWPLIVAATFGAAWWLGPKSAIDIWLLAGGLLLELLVTFIGLKTAGGCTVKDGTLFISNHVGNIVTSASFAVASLSAYLTWSGPSLAAWIQAEADETLQHFGLKEDGRYLHQAANVQSHASQTFDACLELPLTMKQHMRLSKSRGQGEDRLVNEIKKRQENWRQVAGYLNLGFLKRKMIEGHGDRWLAAGAIWLMVFITGQSLVLFLAEVMVGDMRIVCWLSEGRQFFNDLPIEIGYLVAFLGIVTGVGLFRFRILIQTLLESGLAGQAHDLSLQVFKETAIGDIGRVGP